MRARSFLRRLGREDRGIAGVEMALIASAFSLAALNAAEVGRYAYLLMQVRQATQAGAQAAIKTCDTAHLPATTNCTGLSSAVTTAIQSTGLGSSVALNGSISEAWYCLDTHGAMQNAGAADARPSDCTAFGGSGVAPALYVQIPTTYTYAPLFGSMTVASHFPTAITRTAWMRME
jgi:hypothetical protein